VCESALNVFPMIRFVTILNLIFSYEINFCFNVIFQAKVK
jgi:hypothetical protein